MSADPRAAERLTDSYRGLLLGLALGESVGRGLRRSPTGSIAAGVSTQLAAFTVEGMIRASMRMTHKGICSPPHVIWNAYRRWGAGQGLAVHGLLDELFTEAPDGWLREVPALRERRGSSPTTVTALTKSAEPGSPERPLNHSMGCQGLVRVLPLAVLGVTSTREAMVDLARRTTALTHGSTVGLDVTAAAVTVLLGCLGRDDLLDGIHDGANAVHDLALPALDSNAPIGVLGLDYMTGSVQRLASIAPDKSAMSALLGGMYVASTYPHPHQVLEALEFAATAPDGDSVAAVTGALLGAAHGASALPVELLSRHELAWTLDTLARDAVLELSDSPGGHGYDTPRDPHWWDRYPGW